MKMNYEELSWELIRFEAEDEITASDDNEGPVIDL